MSGDQAFAVLGDSGDEEVEALITASSIRAAILGLKVATGLSCTNWVAFGVTMVISSMCSLP